MFLYKSEAVAWRYSVKTVFLKILKNSKENNCVGVFLKLSCIPDAYNFIKKRLSHRCILMNFADFSRIPFYITPLLVASDNGNIDPK